MKTLLLLVGFLLGLTALVGCGCSAEPEAQHQANQPPTNDRERALQGLEARDAALGQDGGAQALQQTLDLRDSLDAQTQQATQQAAGTE